MPLITHKLSTLFTYYIDIATVTGLQMLSLMTGACSYIHVTHENVAIIYSHAQRPTKIINISLG